MSYMAEMEDRPFVLFLFFCIEINKYMLIDTNSCGITQSI